MNYLLNTEYGQPDAEDAKVTQRTQKKTKKKIPKFLKLFSNRIFFEFNLVFLLRPLRNFCVLCVRKFIPSPIRAASTL
jgi:hypothetical protein